MKTQEQLIIENFAVEGSFVSGAPYGSGHINDTRLVILDNGGKEEKYILQRINKNVFKDPASLMENFAGVTSYLSKIIAENGGDPSRETLNVVKTLDGKNYYLDDDGQYWRLLIFVVDSMSFDKVL